ncbi:ATPase P [Oribacterium sp. C9]|uniref:ATPase P n=1 Tax=Oribacterium sp. C9 TaxID=1943579 RepID=UPI00098F5357|nr:ATPase P [Oribacterium sp. C9]OON85593.1 ATPase P [Oribacterium sp. C9]
MLFTPTCLGTTTLSREELKEDKKNCIKVGPCGLGKEAMYLNSFFIDRCYYISYRDISRCFKRVAMSKGGFSGKGIFGTMPYLVVKYGTGLEKQCNFKYEEEVDIFLTELGKIRPDMPLHSVEAEYKLKKAEEEEKARYLKVLSPEQESSVKELRDAEKLINNYEDQYTRLSTTAKQKRVIDRINPTYQKVAMVILMLAIFSAIFGVFSILKGQGMAIYFVLFGFSFIFIVISSRILPTGHNNKRSAQKEWDDALSDMKSTIADNVDFPLPPQYAHPVVIERMIRVIREGRATTIAEAFKTMKDDLRKLNSDVTVSQKEYDEVVTVKPMFLVMDYK